MIIGILETIAKAAIALAALSGADTPECTKWQTYEDNSSACIIWQAGEYSVFADENAPLSFTVKTDGETTVMVRPSETANVFAVSDDESNVLPKVLIGDSNRPSKLLAFSGKHGHFQTAGGAYVSPAINIFGKTFWRTSNGNNYRVVARVTVRQRAGDKVNAERRRQSERADERAVVPVRDTISNNR